MKLYNMNLSPFTGRCRILIYAKGLDVELVDPPGGVASDEYKTINPTGKVPALADSDFLLPESQTICEYLEGKYPERSLTPTDPQARAVSSLLCRVADHYIFPPMAALFGQLDPQGRDQAFVADKIAELGPAFDLVEHWVQAGPHAVGNHLSLADCALFPVYFFATKIVPQLGGPDLLATRPNTAAWWSGVVSDPAVAKVDAEMQAALATFISSQN